MKSSSPLLSAALLGSAIITAPIVMAAQPVLITEEEQVIGWKALFDGKSFKGISSWKSRKPLEAGGWSIEDGVLSLAAKSGGGDIYFPASLAENFELELEWKSEGNSGIFLRVDPEAKGAIWANALEMQIMNDSDQDLTKHSAGALFDLIGLRKGRKALSKDGWNKVKIVCRNGEFTHYLNGKELYRYTVGNETWFDRILPNSKFKDNENFGMFKKGVIGLQDHGDKVSFRNIKFRELTGADAQNRAEKLRREVFAKRGPVISNVLAGNDDAYDVNRAYFVNLLDDSTQVGAVFNADTFQLAGAWTNGGGSGFFGLPYENGHGSTPSWNEKQALFAAKNLPGWANADGKFDDPRASDGKLPNLGGLPSDWAEFHGYYIHGKQVVFSYKVGEAEVLDSPSGLQVGDDKVVVRQLELKGLKQAKSLYLAEGTAEVSGNTATLGATKLSVSGGASFETKEGALYLNIPADAGEKSLLIAAWQGKAGADAVAKAAGALKPLDSYTQGGPARFKTEKPIVTKGVMGKGKGSYLTDKLTLPHENPFGLTMRVGAFDFYPDGNSLAFTTWDGELWKVTGTSGTLDKLEYQLLATGLHESLGIAVVGDDIYTLGADQVTLHKDLNGDGETDFYQTFNNSWPLNKGFHAFTFDLTVDKNGDFWFAQGAPVNAGGRGFERISPANGSIFKLSKDGKELEQFASGFRAPNGIGIGPNGEVTAGDNEGSFMPRCPIHWVTKDYFGGVVDTYAQKDKLNTATWGAEEQKHDPNDMPKPLAWLPRDVDNSGGNQVWVPNDKWGFPKGTMLHNSYGTSSLYSVFHEEVDGQIQGGVAKIPTRLTSSAMRSRFNPADGQLFIGGLRGWQTNAAELGGIDRIRYTGTPLLTVNKVEAKEGGLLVHFNFELDDELAEDPESYAIQAANIKWSRDYGTKEYLIDNPEKEGWSKMEVDEAKLQSDGKSVFLSIEDIQPVHELKLEIDVETKDLDEAIFPVWMTIHKLGK
ncbi:family 16 glycoside hydrolase [Rubritalea tangerina]|uniref:Family 16 glycoside hydrolase n=2 Tax=Rubritalea tangerina TaxID=430798 RepID=A0ABW4ZCH4_9BACT